MLPYVPRPADSRPGVQSGLELWLGVASSCSYRSLWQMVLLPVAIKMDGSFTSLPATSGLIRCLAPTCGASG